MKKFAHLAFLLILALTACLPQEGAYVLPVSSDVTPSAVVSAAQATRNAAEPAAPFVTRPPYPPGEKVEYIAQTGDTLPALAARFNTTIKEIRAANPIIPLTATTMPPGMPMKIPIYYLPLWGNPYQIMPDSDYIDGPAADGLDTAAFVNAHPGWLKGYSDYVSSSTMSGAQIVDFVAREYSVSPRALLALSEYLLGALSDPNLPDAQNRAFLGNSGERVDGYYRQLAWVADTLNNGYYRWRTGSLLELRLSDGRIERPDPWQNAATVALQNYFNILMNADEYHKAIGKEGFGKTYAALFGDRWVNPQPHIPVSLEQPAFQFPFEPGKIWAYTGGPHSAWGEGATPLAAVDFAPPSLASGCQTSEEWVTAMADGQIVRTGTGIAVLDLDGDGNERTGWVIFYLHLSTASIPPVGTLLKRGDRIGHPSCEGGHATGTHVHIARKYNGEWMLADGAVPFDFEGWIAHNGTEAYQGTLLRNGKTITACTCSDSQTFISTSRQPSP